VLLLDDDAHFVEALARCLREEGHAVHVTNASGFTLDVARREPPDVILFGVRPTDLEPGGLASVLRSELPERTAIVGVTGAAEMPRTPDLDLLLHRPIPAEQLGGLLVYIHRRRSAMLSAMA
jgi:ActR/RegA family two-component response regulator